MQFFREIADPGIPIDQGDYYTDVYFPAVEQLTRALIITPTCDLINQKAQFVKLVGTVALDHVIKIMAEHCGIDENYFQAELEISARQREKIMDAIRKNMNGDYLPRYLLIPKFGDVVEYSFLDFQRVFVVSYEQFIRDYSANRRARVISPWRESIAAQYAGYSMRVGTPRYTDDELGELLVSAGLRLP